MENNFTVMDFSAGLRHYRGLKGVTQKELASAIGANNTTVSNWEKGISKPDMDTLADLSNYFGVSVDELMFFGSSADESRIRSIPKDNQERVAVATPSDEGIPLIPLDAMAGFCAGNSAQVMEYECEKYVVPSFRGG
jgi:transcriptional regulator with XRE-family HTH domain